MKNQSNEITEALGSLDERSKENDLILSSRALMEELMAQGDADKAGRKFARVLSQGLQVVSKTVSKDDRVKFEKAMVAEFRGR